MYDDDHSGTWFRARLGYKSQLEMLCKGVAEWQEKSWGAGLRHILASKLHGD